MRAKDTDIVEAIRENPEQGIRMLLARYEKPVYWHIRRLVVSHDDAQDAAQETFVRVYRSIGQFGGESSFNAWLYRIATNEALRLIERRKENTLSLDSEMTVVSQIPADEYFDYNDLVAVRLQKAIQSLPTKQQLAFNLRYYNEMPYEEIAEVTGSTAAAAKANYHVAREKIIQFMNSND